ncbi:MFS transporter [bacterium]|jgi:ACS family hexuronate transporter-like MFS transporter|nr:MFS transporter [Flavobacteriaceae bacterium]MDA9073400.1 MFS transporter [bacterium]MDA9328128.1 MFS transporter [Flavobacteriaceae bacterium]MDA9773020.1 MFS transporter [Flavobacteriaceae bacterium]MDB4025082.1 MFS transporter [Flavobacteriaceae bacterium]
MKLKGLRWWVITLIFIATVINYIDRTAFALLWPEMGEDLGMDNSDYALMLNIFMLTYAASKFLSGRLYDKIGTRIGFVLSIVVWSAAAAFHAVARGVATLSIARGLLGLGEAGLWPGAVKSNGEWFPVKQRALAQGIFNSGASIGNVIAPVVIVYLYSQFGWKSTYVILGVVGLLWVIPWLIINKSNPKDHPWITNEERNMLLNDRIENNNVVDENAKSLSVAKILSFKQPWGVLLCRFFIEPIWWFFAGWMPIYLNSKFGLSIEEIGKTMWISYLMAAAGSILGGIFTEAIIKRRSTDYGRKASIILGSLLIIIGFVSIILFVNDTNYMTFIYLAGLALFGFQFAIGNIQTLSSDLFRGPSVGTLAGLAGTVAAFSVMIMNWFIGRITEGGSYTPALITITASVVLAVLSILFLIRKVELVIKKLD